MPSIISTYQNQLTMNGGVRPLQLTKYRRFKRCLEANAWVAEARKGDEVKISETEVARGEHFAATTKGKTQNLYIRVLWSGNRFYQVMVGFPPKPSYQQEMDAKKFVWSLKLHSALQN